LRGEAPGDSKKEKAKENTAAFIYEENPQERKMEDNYMQSLERIAAEKKEANSECWGCKGGTTPKIVTESPAMKLGERGRITRRRKKSRRFPLKSRLFIASEERKKKTSKRLGEQNS